MPHGNASKVGGYPGTTGRMLSEQVGGYVGMRSYLPRSSGLRQQQLPGRERKVVRGYLPRSSGLSWPAVNGSRPTGLGDSPTASEQVSCSCECHATGPYHGVGACVYDACI